jgi:hypothetical protein
MIIVLVKLRKREYALPNGWWGYQVFLLLLQPALPFVPHLFASPIISIDRAAP